MNAIKHTYEELDELLLNDLWIVEGTKFETDTMRVIEIECDAVLRWCPACFGTVNFVGFIPTKMSVN